MNHLINSQTLPSLIIFSVCMLFIIVFLLIIKRKKNKAVYSSNQKWKQQNKEFLFASEPDHDVCESIGPVRIRKANPLEQSTIPSPATTLIDETPPADWPKVLCLYVKAKPHQLFYGYDLMQSILNHGMEHGVLDFFHYRQNNQTLFTLTAIEPPGTIQLAEIGNFKTKGVCLFLQPHRFQKPILAFETMVDNAKKIAEELDGVLEDENHHILTPERLNYWRSTLEDPKAK